MTTHENDDRDTHAQSMIHRCRAVLMFALLQQRRKHANTLYSHLYARVRDLFECLCSSYMYLAQVQSAGDALFSTSTIADHVDVFISHSWSAGRWGKFFSLCL